MRDDATVLGPPPTVVRLGRPICPICWHQMGKYFFGNREVVRLNLLVLFLSAARVNEEGLEDVRVYVWSLDQKKEGRKAGSDDVEE